MALYKWSKYSIQWVESSSQVTDPPITFNSVYWYSEGKPSFDASGSYTLPTSLPLPSSTTSQGVSGRYVSNAQITSEIYYGQSSVFINGNTKQLEGRFEKYTTSPTKGAFIGFVYSTDQSAYPNDGISDGYYYDQREIVVPSPPVALNVPDIAMQGNQITVSWSAVSIADSYILERKANTDSDWTQVYSGANLTFSETVGTWTSVQYRVKAGVSGTYGDYTTSASVPVVSASALVISGSDGDLGTLVNDVSYTVSSNDTTTLTVTETVNGATTRTFTATNGATNKIHVMDLPTGSGTIKITASTNPGSGVVTVTRSWTYSKTAPTFANTGSTAQLQQNGKNVFPLTLLECVRGGENLAPGGYGLGENYASQLVDFNSAVRSGWYYSISQDVDAAHFPEKLPGAGYGLVRADSRGSSSYQTFYNYGYTATRYTADVGVTWSPWEYVNPPMQLGVEYRTVERYNGKPVYTKAVNFGALPANSSKSVAHGILNMATCFEVRGSYGIQNLVGEGAITTIGANEEYVVIGTDRNLSSETAIVLIKYTKTTD